MILGHCGETAIIAWLISEMRSPIPKQSRTRGLWNKQTGSLREYGLVCLSLQNMTPSLYSSLCFTLLCLFLWLQDTEAAAIMSSSFQTLKSTSAYHLGEWTKALSQGGSTPHSCYDASLYEGMDVKVSRRSKFFPWLNHSTVISDIPPDWFLLPPQDSSFSGIQLLF